MVIGRAQARPITRVHAMPTIIQVAGEPCRAETVTDSGRRAVRVVRSRFSVDSGFMVHGVSIEIRR